jgi:hypothetical protein
MQESDLYGGVMAMTKYYVYFDTDNCIMTIGELDQTALDNRCGYEKRKNTMDGLPVLDTIEDCILSLGSYTKRTLLPNGETIKPCEVNYTDDNVLKRVIFPVVEY